jgi:hypothetical protein
MTDLTDISEKLQDTVAAIAAMEATLIRTRDAGVNEILATLRRRHDDLEARFVALADAQETEVCRYRILRSGAAFPIAVLADSLRAFQSWLTVTFDAVAHGPKARSRVSADVVQRTTLDLGYVYPGSVGFVLTIPNQRLLIGETDLDAAVHQMFDMLRAESSTQLRNISRRVGVAPIRKMHDWVSSHAKADLSADIKWERGETVKSDILFQSEEAVRLASLVESTSDETIERVTLTGFLQGGDLDSRSFHLSFPETQEADDIRGYMTKSFAPKEELQLGKRYEADLVKHTVTRYAIEDDSVWWEMENIRAVS